MQRLLLALCLLTACGDDFATAQQAGTIEAFETYLEENPSGRHQLAAVAVLETLYLEAAREAGTLEAYDRYLARFPNGDLRTKVLEERESFLFAWAKERGTAEGWSRFLHEYPSADKKRKAEALRLMLVASYAPDLSWTDLVIEPVNLAEDPNGPKNGWGFRTTVTNNGDRTLTDLRFTLDLTSEAGSVIASNEWPVVAKVWPLPIEDEHKVPMKPGDTRVWSWSQEDPAPGRWKQGAKLRPTRITFLD